MNHRPKVSGFTLLEISIVIALIVILSAIAVPNFLEAQVRAKVSRVKSDHRSLATALESYFVDYGHYPAANPRRNINDQDINPLHGIFNEDIRIDAFPSVLTALSTPVAYIMNGLLPDPFPSRYAPSEIPYSYLIRTESSFAFDGQVYDLPINDSLLDDGIAYILSSSGPDGSSSYFEPMYDPTNGTISTGNIIRTNRSGIRNSPIEPPEPIRATFSSWDLYEDGSNKLNYMTLGEQSEVIIKLAENVDEIVKQAFAEGISPTEIELTESQTKVLSALHANGEPDGSTRNIHQIQSQLTDHITVRLIYDEDAFEVEPEPVRTFRINYSRVTPFKFFVTPKRFFSARRIRYEMLVTDSNRISDYVIDEGAATVHIRFKFWNFLLISDMWLQLLKIFGVALGGWIALKAVAFFRRIGGKIVRATISSPQTEPTQKAAEEGEIVLHPRGKDDKSKEGSDHERGDQQP